MHLLKQKFVLLPRAPVSMSCPVCCYFTLKSCCGFLATLFIYPYLRIYLQHEMPFLPRFVGFSLIVVLCVIFGPKRDEAAGEWRRLHNEELNELYSLPNIIR
jgi:hypothetical protein